MMLADSLISSWSCCASCGGGRWPASVPGSRETPCSAAMRECAGQLACPGTGPSRNGFYCSVDVILKSVRLFAHRTCSCMWHCLALRRRANQPGVAQRLVCHLRSLRQMTCRSWLDIRGADGHLHGLCWTQPCAMILDGASLRRRRGRRRILCRTGDPRFCLHR